MHVPFVLPVPVRGEGRERESGMRYTHRAGSIGSLLYPLSKLPECLSEFALIEMHASSRVVARVKPVDQDPSADPFLSVGSTSTQAGKCQYCRAVENSYPNVREYASTPATSAIVSSRLLVISTGASPISHFLLEMVKDTELVVSVVKFGTKWEGSLPASEKYLAADDHTNRRSYEIDPECMPIVGVKC